MVSTYTLEKGDEQGSDMIKGMQLRLWHLQQSQSFSAACEKISSKKSPRYHGNILITICLAFSMP